MQLDVLLRTHAAAARDRLAEARPPVTEPNSQSPPCHMHARLYGSSALCGCTLLPLSLNTVHFRPGAVLIRVPAHVPAQVPVPCMIFLHVYVSSAFTTT